MATKKSTKKSTKMPKTFNLHRAIQKETYYKSNVLRRDKETRKYFNESANKFRVDPNKFKLGSLYLFDYLRPKLEEELEYYDAQPCTIFFGNIKTKDGERRVLGFNLHYYPPRIRYQVLDRIMQIYRPFYKKYWASRSPEDVDQFQYELLIWQLQKAKLEFGVRMYIPELITKSQLIEPRDWQKAVFTEGRFKKQTRQAIIKYWTNKLIDRQLIARASKNKVSKAIP